MSSARRPARLVTRLDRRTRELLEHGFGIRLESLRLEIVRGPDRPRAYALRDRIVVDERLYRPDTSSGRYLLAHETAHVVQKKRTDGVDASARPGALEAEADLAAASVISGRRFDCRLADPSGRPRRWEESGHYYTAYLVMLAAGVDKNLAAKLASLSQIADQVDVFDATYVGELLGLSAANVTASLMSGPRAIVKAPLAWLKFEEQRRKTRAIQEGLHALTGRDQDEETRIRAEVLRTTPLDSTEFGLAIHAYGDSFAHRRMNGSGKMYAGPLGHLVRAVEDDPNADSSTCDPLLAPSAGGSSAIAYEGCVLSSRYLHNPHDPDRLHMRIDYYREYGLGFFDILQKKLPQAKPNMERKLLATRLDEVSALISGRDQIARLRAIAIKDVGIPMEPYEPENEGSPITWRAYMMNHPTGNSGVSPALLDDILRTAEAWTNLK